MKMIYLQFSLDHEMLLPLHHVTYAATKFKAAAADGLGEDYNYMKTHARTYAHTHGQTDGQTQMDQLWYEIYVPFFSTRKSGYKMSILRIHLQYLICQ